MLRLPCPFCRKRNVLALRCSVFLVAEIVALQPSPHAAMASPRKRSTISVSDVGLVFIFLLGTGLLLGRNVLRSELFTASTSTLAEQKEGKVPTAAPPGGPQVTGAGETSPPKPLPRLC